MGTSCLVFRLSRRPIRLKTISKMKLLIPLVAAVAMTADGRRQPRRNSKAMKKGTLDEGFNVRPIVNKWKPVQNVGLVQYADNVEIVDTVEIAEQQPIKYYNGARYNNGYNGYTGDNRYNGYNSNVGQYNTGYTTGFNTAYPTNAVYNTGYNNYRLPYMQNTYNQYKPVEKVVEKVVEKIEDIKHHIEDHREEHHDDIIREVQMPNKGTLKYFFGKPEVKEATGKYSSVTGKYYNPYKNDVKVVDKIVKEDFQRPINNGFYNNFNNYVQQPLQYFQQQVQRPVRYVQQQNDQDWFNTFLTYYALTKNSDADEVIDG